MLREFVRESLRNPFNSTVDEADLRQKIKFLSESDKRILALYLRSRNPINEYKVRSGASEEDLKRHSLITPEMQQNMDKYKEEIDKFLKLNDKTIRAATDYYQNDSLSSSGAVVPLKRLYLEAAKIDKRYLPAKANFPAAIAVLTLKVTNSWDNLGGLWLRLTKSFLSSGWNWVTSFFTENNDYVQWRGSSILIELTGKDVLDTLKDQAQEDQAAQEDEDEKNTQPEDSSWLDTLISTGASYLPAYLGVEMMSGFFFTRLLAKSITTPLGWAYRAMTSWGIEPEYAKDLEKIIKDNPGASKEKLKSLIDDYFKSIGKNIKIPLNRITPEVARHVPKSAIKRLMQLPAAAAARAAAGGAPPAPVPAPPAPVPAPPASVPAPPASVPTVAAPVAGGAAAGATGLGVAGTIGLIIATIAASIINAYVILCFWDYISPQWMDTSADFKPVKEIKERVHDKLESMLKEVSDFFSEDAAMKDALQSLSGAVRDESITDDDLDRLISACRG